MNILMIVYQKVFEENPESGKSQDLVNFYSKFINFMCNKWNADRF